MGNKKDINLLPEEFRGSSSKPPNKQKDEGTLKEVGDSVKGLVDMISSTVSSVQYEKSKEMISNISKSLKDNITGNLQQGTDRPSGFLHSPKKMKLRNLEALLNIDKKDLIVASKVNYVYCTDFGKVVIVDKDANGEPHTVTIKDCDNITVKYAKFTGDRAFLYPKFNEKGLPDEIIYMDSDQIWYMGNNEAILVMFQEDVPDFLIVNLKDFKNIKNTKALLNYLDCCKTLYLDKNLSDLLLEERKVNRNDIIRIRPHYALYMESSNIYKVLLLDEEKNVCNEFSLHDLPNVNEEAWDVLFSNDLYEYVKANDYSFNNFRQDNDHIEYWQNIGSKRVCVMRCKIS